MKKFVLWGLIFVFLFSFSCSIAETSVSELMTTFQNFSKKRLDSIIAFYQQSPDDFDEEYVEMAYKYFRLYKSLVQMIAIEDNYELKQGVLSQGKGVRGSMIFDGMASKADKLLNDLYEEQWYKYRNGEVTKEKLMDIVIDQLNVEKTIEEKLNNQ